MTRYGDASPRETGTVMTVEFELERAAAATAFV